VPKRGRDAPVTAADVTAFIEKFCFIPEGRFVGQPLRLVPFQRAEIVRIYDNPNRRTRRAIISMGRKCAKTVLSACLLLNHLCGPSARSKPNSQLYSTATSRDQAALTFGYAAKMVRLNRDLAAAISIKESAKMLVCTELGTSYRALSADATTALGLSPAFCIHDELGAVTGPRSELYDALELATGAAADPLSIVISTQAPADTDLLSVLIDDAMQGHDPATTCSLYTAPQHFDPFGEDAIRAANPAFDFFQNKTEILAMAAAAKRMPAREAEYRRFVLNQRTEIATPFVPISVWNDCRGQVTPLNELPVLFGGLDLSAVDDLTALVLIGRKGDVWHAHCRFWLPTDGLRERSQRDRVPYDEWHKQGYLQVCPGRTVSYEWVAHELRQLFRSYNIQRCAFDRWNFKHLKPWLIKAGFTEQMIAEKFQEFGQGTQSMSPAMRDLEQCLLDRRLVHDNPILTSCIAHTVIRTDSAGNRAPDKRKSTARIDGTVALLMALAQIPTATPVFDPAALIG
jgi:phage terminase large subunit-like protein